jgi:asparagine synthase (glutamine-hydrolysing)
MCGLAGILRFDDHPIDDADRHRLMRMLEQVRHRGPDGEGVSFHGHCALVHARLSIIDLLSGQQPMHLTSPDADADADDACALLHLVFNGEVYNHRELRAKLEKRGHVFRSDHSDTEVLLLGYREWGTMLPKHLHGMFAFVIYDEARRELFLCRDRTGKKPLYFRRDGGELIFGSMVATIVAGARPGTGVGVDPAALLTFLRYGYPFSRSMVAGVEEVPPAHWMLFGRGGKVTSERYWRPPPTSRHSTSLGAVDALREVLREAVWSRLEADVPLACFLSGGIDSSLIAALAQQRLAKDGERLRTFSVAMPDAFYDESPHALQVARHIGADHTVLTAEPGDAIADLRRLMAVAGEPTADSSLLPTYWLCRATRRHVKVALSGDGGDELFGGYDRYRALRLLRRWRWLLAALPTTWLSDVDPKAIGTRFRRLADAAGAGADPARQYHRMIHLFTDEQVRAMGIATVRDGLLREPPAAPDWPDEPDVVHAAMRWDLVHYLPFELLRKLDRASMAVSLEVRCPMLDTQVADLAGHLPDRVLMPAGRPKGLLRALATEYLPLPIVNRPKRGFAVPIGGWFRTTLRDPLHDHLFDGSLGRLGVDETPVRRWFDEHTAARADHTHRLFALLQLSLWRSWLDDPTPPG